MRAGRIVVGLGLLAALMGPGPAKKAGKVVSAEYAGARRLFVDMFQPGAPGPAGGDGLGPLYNEQSCVGCHHQGGIGGGGANDRNVTILAVRPGAAIHDGRVAFQGELEDLHPGLRNRTSVVLHHHATNPADEARLGKIRGTALVQTRDQMFTLVFSSRSTPALFGAGLIDDIPDSVLIAAAGRAGKRDDFPEIRGRLSRLADGTLGRFGWKGQTGSLGAFVRAACANELGLEVPQHHQPGFAAHKEFDATALKLDLDGDQCNQLTRFVDSLPRPTFEPAAAADVVLRGRRLFDAVGCAACHVPTLGKVDGLYSDLLLHDLGDRMRSFGGSYGGGGRPGAVVDRGTTAPKGDDAADRPTGEAGPGEWRTPPLWGSADSAPYLHDGRAATFDEAIRLHGGEAAKTTERYARLTGFERQELLAFLHSLRAPRTPERLAAGRSKGKR